MVSAELSLLPFEQGLAALAAGLRALLEALSLATVLLGLLVSLRQGWRGVAGGGSWSVWSSQWLTRALSRLLRSPRMRSMAMG